MKTSLESKEKKSQHKMRVKKINGNSIAER
jgi:hypothetical protein